MFAHGDYQDKGTTYDTKWVDLSTDKKKICNFIKTVSSTCGFDSDECYELVLRQVSDILYCELSGGGGGEEELSMQWNPVLQPPH